MATTLLSDNFDTENSGGRQNDYDKLTNWNVTDGSVDLIGNGYFDFFPGNGLYLDLDGTRFKAGRLESKTRFNLSLGDQVTLSFSLAGSQRSNGSNSVDVFLGQFRESFTLPSSQPFTPITRTFTVTSDVSSNLIFSHAQERSDGVGLLLDNVELSVVRYNIPTIVGTETNDVLAGGPVDEVINGMRGDDYLIGNDGNDTLVGGRGDDTLSGGLGSDFFVFDSERRFTRPRVGTDKILDFQRPDKIVLDKTTFDKLQDQPFSFASVNSIQEAASSSALFTYIVATGTLVYNRDGAAAGFDYSLGGPFADLTDGLTLTAADFIVQA